MRLVLYLFFGLMVTASISQELPLLKISKNQHYLVTGDNEPFFWLGGTAWELIHRLTKEEIDHYLKDRAEKGFTIIQTVVLAELDGLNTPNAYGYKPLIENDPERLNDRYFELVDYVVQKCQALGLYVALLPTWGDKFNQKWGAGPVVFNPENAKSYGMLLATRYLSNYNLVWVLGGDRAPENETHYAIIRAMAQGIKNVDSIHLVTYHPVGARKATDFFPNDSWLDFDMYQSGHSRLSKEYSYVLDQRMSTTMPVVNGEARYENIPDRFWEDQSYGWLDDTDVRVSAYWTMLAGAAGYTYGCNDIWQMYTMYRTPILQACTGWQPALDLPGAGQMIHLRQIFEQFPWQNMEVDQSLILNENPQDESYMLATKGPNGDFVLAYTPMGKPIEIDMSKLKQGRVYGYWFNPRSGELEDIGEFDASIPSQFNPPSQGRGSDYLLVLTKEPLSLP
jgi:hypothetical protein